MATPPEDDFPTKTTADALREDRDRTGASKMTVEIAVEPRPVPEHLKGLTCCLGHRYSNPVVTEPAGCRPSAYNLIQKTDPDYERLRESRARAAEARELRRQAVRESGGDDQYQLAAACARAMDRSQAEIKTAYRILSSLGDIGPRAQSLLVKIAERLAHGARQYGGDFDDKPRDWNKEALEEHMDAVVYMAMACMERDEAKAADKVRAEAACRGPATTTAMPPIDMRHYNIDPRDGAPPAPTWPLTTPGEDWEKTRDGCG